jgi:hypothetical protein
MNMNSSIQQLEISLPGSRHHSAKHRRQLRAARARWWFGRMRHAVESAADWTPPTGRRSSHV